MRRLPGPGAARNALAAAAVGATLVTAACGSQHAGSASAGAGSPSGAAQPGATQCSQTPPATADHTVNITGQDNGKVLCVGQGTVVAVYLQGSPDRRWSAIRASSSALRPVANGRLMLKLGETGAFFKAAHPGVATVTSSLPSCPSPGTATSGPHCKMGEVFRVTLVIS